MMIYRELYSLYEQEEELVTNVTISSLETLIGNIRAMTTYFGYNSTENNKNQRQDIIIELRNLEKIMTQVKIDIINYL